MAFYVRDEATDAAVRRLAGLRGRGLTETIREVVENELAREKAKVSLTHRLSPLVERYRAFPETGLDADKAFFDALSGDD
jgi:antitoxin VapB